MDPRQQQAAAAIQKMAQMDPEFVKMQKIAEMKALIHEHTSRCWETCNLGDQARNSSLSTYTLKVGPKTSVHQKSIFEPMEKDERLHWLENGLLMDTNFVANFQSIRTER